MTSPIPLVREQLALLARGGHPVSVVAIADQLGAAARDAPADLVSRAGAATGRAAASLAVNPTREAAEQMGLCVQALRIAINTAEIPHSNI